MGVNHPGNIYQEISALRREVRRIGKMTMQHASIGRAGFRVYDGGVITIEDGGLHVTGTATIVGLLTGSGEFIWTGPVSIEGPATISGDTDIVGALTIAGNTDLTGDMTVTGDIVVTSTGRIHVGNMTLDPSSNGGSIRFPNGAEVFADATTIQVFKGNSVCQVHNDYARLQYGGNVVEISASGIRMSPAAVATYSGSGLPSGTLRITAAGIVQRAT